VDRKLFKELSTLKPKNKDKELEVEIISALSAKIPKFSSHFLPEPIVTLSRRFPLMKKAISFLF